MGYTFLSNINFSIDKTQEKYYFSDLNSLGPPAPSIPHSNKVAQQSVFSVVVDPQWDTFS